MARTNLRAMTDILQPSVTALRPETLLVPFTDYSRWERKHAKGSVSVRTQQAARTLAPISAHGVRKTSKSTAPEAKKQRSNHVTRTFTAQVRLQPVAVVCNHGQGIRRKSVAKFNAASTASSGESHVKVFKGQGQISPEKQHKPGRLGRSHEPTNIRLLRVTHINLVSLSSIVACRYQT